MTMKTITAADACLMQLGAENYRFGLVVCDSGLNLMNTCVYKMQNLVSDDTWRRYTSYPNTDSLQHALAYIQTIMAVLDYYDDVNVKNRYAQTYLAVG